MAVLPATVILLLICITTFGQEESRNQKPEMAELMRSNGKIYVVVAVMTTILTGLILYVARLDRKITRLEKEK